MATVVDVDGTWVNDVAVAWDAAELRRADAGAFTGRGDTFGARGGIVRHSDSSLLVSVDGSDVVTIQPGSVVIPGSAVANTGIYRASIGAAETEPLAARHATNPRIDLVVFRQLDTDVVGSHAAYTSRIEIIDGTPGAVPAVPALPSMAVELARINVPALGGGAASADLTKRTFAAAIGAILPVTTEAQLPAAAATRQRAVALDTGTFYDWDGTAWVEEVRPTQKVGTAAMAFNASGEAVLTHNLGTAPTFVGLTHDSIGGNIDLKPKSGTIGVNTVTVIARTLNDVAYVGSLSIVRYHVIA